MIDTAYVHVAQRVGGHFLFHLINATLLIANLGSGMAAQFGAARLLYGMGRSDVGIIWRPVLRNNQQSPGDGCFNAARCILRAL